MSEPPNDAAGAPRRTPTMLPLGDGAREPRRPGCQKPALWSCGSVLLLLLVASFLLSGRRESIVRWGLAQSREMVFAALPAEVGAAERERLERAFAATAEVLAADELDAAGRRLLQSSLGEARRAARDGTLDREGVDKLTAALEVLGNVTADKELQGVQ